MRFTVPGVRYAALGDSAGVGVGAHSGGGYVDRVADRLRKAGFGIDLRNFCQSGATIHDVTRAQVRRAIDAKPTLITLCIGGNDIWRGTRVDDYAHQLDAIAAQLATSGAPTLLVNIPDLSLAPIAAMVPRALYEGRIEAFNEWIEAIALRHGLTLVDMYAATRTFCPNPALFCADGFHPSAAGYEKWAEAMWPTVEAAVRGAGSRMAG